MRTPSLLLIGLSALICTCETVATTGHLSVKKHAADTWEYRYTTENSSLAVPIEELTLFFGTEFCRLEYVVVL